MSRIGWAGAPRRLLRGTVRGVRRATYNLNSLVEARLIGPRKARQFREKTGLTDFAWEATWSTRAGRRPREALARAEGCVVLIHGWDGSHAIWEDLPARICLSHPRLFVLAPDVNGFGGSPFAEELPPLETCDPAALMRAVAAWVELTGLRSSPRAWRRYRVVTFVGHSMGGAAIFYLDEDRWRPHEVARLALAPALLLNDRLRKEFYKALGVGIWAGAVTNTLDWLKDRLASPLIEALIGDASQAVKDEHLRIFKNTSRGVLAQTFYAMGATPRPIRRRRWRHFQVVLGHRDRLVGVGPMLQLLEELGFTSEDVRVMFGDHYFFSPGLRSRRLHGLNRQLIVRQILDLHRECRRAQRELVR